MPKMIGMLTLPTSLMIYGRMPAHNPLVGNFHHAPSAKNAGSKYFESELTSMNEYERNKSLRNNPFTGQFHRGPANYSELHNLRRFRNSLLLAKRDDSFSTGDSSFREPANSDCEEASLESVSSRVVVSTEGQGPQDDAHLIRNEKEPQEYSSSENDEKFNEMDEGETYRKQSTWFAALRALPDSEITSGRNFVKGRDRYDEDLDLNRANSFGPPKRRRASSDQSIMQGRLMVEAGPNFFKEAALGQKSVQYSGRSEWVPALPFDKGSQRRLLESNSKDGSVRRRKRLARLMDQNPWIVNTATKVTDKYEVDRSPTCDLGTGSYSIVKAITHRGTGRPFALKVIDKRYLYDKEEKEMIKREVQIHQILDHGNIIRLYDIYENSKCLYLVLEQANCGTLADLMQDCRARLSEPEISLILAKVFDAVVYLHENGILQGDIKPSNILLSNHANGTSQDFIGWRGSSIRNLTPKLCDFGLSRKVPDVKYYKITGDVHKAPYTNFRGTVGYCAPEILSEEAYTIAADIWSLGIIFYELTSGTRPFVPYRDCLTEEVSFPEPLWRIRSRECKDLVLELLRKDPTRRIKAAEARHHPWFTLGELSQFS